NAFFDSSGSQTGNLTRSPASVQNSRSGHGWGFFLPLILFQQTLGALCFPISKYGLAVIEPFTFAFFRFLIASVVLLTMVHFQKQDNRIARRDYPRIIGIGVLIIIGNQTAYLWGQSLTAAGHGAVLFATTPIWVLIMAIFILKEKLTWQKAVGIPLALIGALILVTGGAIKVGAEYLKGDLIILVSVWAWGAYAIFGKPLAEKYGALRVTAYALASGAVAYFPFGLYRALTFDYSHVTLVAWLPVLYMALGSSVASYVIWYWLLKYMEASKLAVFSNIQPVIATTVAFFTLGEIPGPAFLIGSAIVLTGVIVTEV
ncbi:MAG TPA: EamA family transporter, partial [Candidatus Acidoferrum sp.]|nr:EamA family transporter [Candidatus Acidoferrum sp.]